MNKPKIRSKIVDEKIKRAYAKLAQAHFNRALTIAESALFLSAEAVSHTNIRIACVEDYLERAGAEASKWGFRP